MGTRHIYIARHGEADPFGELTDAGKEQARLLGDRLRDLPIDNVWHSPLARAAASAQEIALALPQASVAEAPELIDHVPYVPPAADTPASWLGFFDGYDQTEADAGNACATALIKRFASASASKTGSAKPDADTHELLITHDYPIAWLVCHALNAPPARWLGLASANTALTVIEYRQGLPPTLVMFNEMSHLPRRLRWTGFRTTVRP